MPIAGFQHINTRSADAERTRDFYVHVLGLRVGDRPPLRSSGYWLYLGDQPIVHLVQRDPVAAVTAGESVSFDHVAFSCTNLDATRQALQAAGIAFRETVGARAGAVQIRVQDPDGIQLELNFAIGEHERVPAPNTL